MFTKHQVAHLIFQITVNDMSRDGEIFRKVLSEKRLGTSMVKSKIISESDD